MFGGYGPFSSHWGLGVDQIVAATLVNAEGEIVEADESMLKCIRGAGAIFGIILSISIKVYPLKSVGTRQPFFFLLFAFANGKLD